MEYYTTVKEEKHMCSIVLVTILTVTVVMILVSVVSLGGVVTSILFSDLFVGAAVVASIIYLIKKYGKKK